MLQYHHEQESGKVIMNERSKEARLQRRIQASLLVMELL